MDKPLKLGGTEVTVRTMHVIDTTIGSKKNGDLSHVVAREGSELARHLQGRGWRATLGWRSETDDGSVWLVRFEPADDSVVQSDPQTDDDALMEGLTQGGS